MSDRHTADMLIEDTRAQSSAGIVAPRTYPMGRRPGGDSAAISERIGSVRTELAAGNVSKAIKHAHTISGVCARQGDHRIASLVRHAVRATRGGLHTEAANLLAQADEALTATV
ncbi:MAG: hypothetical protein AB7P40_07420 [Chloroflexota bacterium]